MSGSAVHSVCLASQLHSLPTSNGANLAHLIVYLKDTMRSITPAVHVLLEALTAHYVLSMYTYLAFVSHLSIYLKHSLCQRTVCGGSLLNSTCCSSRNPNQTWVYGLFWLEFFLHNSIASQRSLLASCSRYLRRQRKATRSVVCIRHLLARLMSHLRSPRL